MGLFVMKIRKSLGLLQEGGIRALKGIRSLYAIHKSSSLSIYMKIHRRPTSRIFRPMPGCPRTSRRKTSSRLSRADSSSFLAVLLGCTATALQGELLRSSRAPFGLHSNRRNFADFHITPRCAVFLLEKLGPEVGQQGFEGKERGADDADVGFDGGPDDGPDARHDVVALVCGAEDCAEAHDADEADYEAEEEG